MAAGAKRDVWIVASCSSRTAFTLLIKEIIGLVLDTFFTCPGHSLPHREWSGRSVFIFFHSDMESAAEILYLNNFQDLPKTSKFAENKKIT